MISATLSARSIAFAPTRMSAHTAVSLVPKTRATRAARRRRAPRPLRPTGETSVSAPEGTTAGSNPDDENGFPKMFPSDIPLVPEHAAAPFCVCCPYFSW